MWFYTRKKRVYPLENSNDVFVVVTNLIFIVDTNKIKVELQDAS